MTTLVRRAPVIAVGVVVGLALGIARLVAGGEAWSAAIAALIPVAYAVVVTFLAPGSETAAMLAGRPVDERGQHIGLEAGTWAFGAGAVTVLVALVLVTLQDGDWLPYALIGGVMGVAYAGSLALVRLRH